MCDEGGDQGGNFQEVEVRDDWYGSGDFFEEDVFGDVPGWVGEGYILEIAHYCGCQD